MLLETRPWSRGTPRYWPKLLITKNPQQAIMSFRGLGRHVMREHSRFRITDFYLEALQSRSRVFLTSIIREGEASANNRRSSTNIKWDIAGPLLPMQIDPHLPHCSLSDIKRPRHSTQRTKRYRDKGHCCLIPPSLIPQWDRSSIEYTSTE